MSFAADAGIKAGVYDFADPVNVSPTAEAQFFVNYAKDFLSNGRGCFRCSIWNKVVA